MQIALTVQLILLATIIEIHAQTITSSSPIHVDAGVHTGAVVRAGENWRGATGGHGGWVSIGGEQFRLEVDLTRSNKLRSSGTACVDRTCAHVSPGTEVIQQWIAGAVALWHFRISGPVVPHVVGGIGSVRNASTYDFTDSTIPDTGFRNTQGVFIGGVGVDFRAPARVFGRIEYRLNFKSLETTIHQFQLGGGIRF